MSWVTWPTSAAGRGTRGLTRSSGQRSWYAIPGVDPRGLDKTLGGFLALVREDHRAEVRAALELAAESGGALTGAELVSSGLWHVEGDEDYTAFRRVTEAEVACWRQSSLLGLPFKICVNVSAR
jgi:hypothetical protein